MSSSVTEQSAHVGKAVWCGWKTREGVFLVKEASFIHWLGCVYCGTLNSQWHTQKSSQTGQEVGVWRVSEEYKGSQPEVVPGRCFTPPCSYPTMFLPEGVPLPQCHMTQHKLYGELEGIHISSTYEEALSTRAGWKWEQLPWSRMCFPCVRNLLSSVGGGSVADRWRTSCSLGVYSVEHRWNISPSSRHLTAVPFPFGGGAVFKCSFVGFFS